MAVMITAIIFIFATNAKAEGFDYDTAMKKAEKEINNKDYLKAFNTIKEIGHNSHIDNNPYGKYLFESATAKLYYNQGDNAMAEKNYRNAIETAESSLPNTDTGNDYLGTRNIIAGMSIPIYTISYNYAADSLSELASINEAASIVGNSEDVTYKLRNLFNAEM